MPDAADRADAIVAEHLARNLRRVTTPIATGTPGECENCGEDMPRLVGGLCGYCRDGRIPMRSEPQQVEDVEMSETVTPMPAPAIEADPHPGRIVAVKLTGDLLETVELRARQNGEGVATALLSLIDTWRDELATMVVNAAAEAEPETAPDTCTPRERMVALMDGIAELLIEQIDRADTAEAGSVSQEALDAATARAEAAEAKLAQIRAAFG